MVGARRPFRVYEEMAESHQPLSCPIPISPSPVPWRWARSCLGGLLQLSLTLKPNKRGS